MAITQIPSSGLSTRSRRCIEKLQAYQADATPANEHENTRHAAVLVLLYEKDGNLRVLLTTRAKTMRTHPGQTALPGGAKDDTDTDIVYTAYREAHEEVGLPLNHPGVHTLCILRPFIAWTRSFVLVTPVVALLTDLSVLEDLRAAPGEVDLIYDHPLEALLDPQLSKAEPLVDLNSELWPSSDPSYNYVDSHWAWMGDSTYRLHRFRSAAAAIKGLTADVLILTATIAYERPPSFDRFAPGQSTNLKDTLNALDLTAFNKWNKRELVVTANGVSTRPVSLE